MVDTTQNQNTTSSTDVTNPTLNTIAYTKTAWFDNITLVNAERMNNIENGIDTLFQYVNSLNIVKSETSHTHNTLYYTKNEVANLLSAITTNMDGYVKDLDFQVYKQKVEETYAKLEHKHDDLYAQINHEHVTDNIKYKEKDLTTILDNILQVTNRGCPRYTPSLS